MTRRLTYHKLLHRDGLWRIADLKYMVQADLNLQANSDRIAPREDLRIQVAIGKVAQAGEKERLKDLTIVEVPIGDLPLLRRNRLIQDGYLLYEQYELEKESDVNLTLDLSPENLKFFKRFDTENSKPIFKNTKYSTVEDSDLRFVGVGYNSDPYGIIISCVDIFSFFYANSTFLTQLILSESILNPETAVYDSEKSIKTGRFRKIWLKEGVPSNDARHLAMLLFDDYALEAAQSIYQHRDPKGREAKKWPIRATPPIKGKVKLKLKGRYFGNRLVVTEIIKCGWTPPFDHLEWERDNRSSPSEPGTISSGPSRRLIDVDSPEKISDEPGDRRTVPSEVRQTYLGHRFPRLKAVSLKRSPRPNHSDSEKTGARYFRETVPTKEASTALGGSGPSKRRAEVRGPEESPPDSSRQQRELENVQLEAKDINDQCVSSALMLLEAHNSDLARVDFLNPGFARTTLLSGEDRIPLCLLPSIIDNKEKAWLFSDKPKLRQRAALIARVEFHGEVRFVFELQKRMNQNISTTLIWREPHCEIQEGLLEELLPLIAGPTTSLERTLFTTQHNLQWGRCRHKSLSGTKIQRAEEFLNRLFDTSALQEGDEDT
jgi:hypothetical protein